MIYITYFNLKNGVSEEEFVNKSKELLGYLEGKIEGGGPVKFYRHDLGANPRTYQMHWEIRDCGTWDKLVAFIKKDAKGARLYQEMRKLMDMGTHYDKLVSEIPL